MSGEMAIGGARGSDVFQNLASVDVDADEVVDVPKDDAEEDDEEERRQAFWKEEAEKALQRIEQAEEAEHQRQREDYWQRQGELALERVRQEELSNSPRTS